MATVSPPVPRGRRRVAMANGKGNGKEGLVRTWLPVVTAAVVVIAYIVTIQV